MQSCVVSRLRMRNAFKTRNGRKCALPRRFTTSGNCGFLCLRSAALQMPSPALKSYECPCVAFL
jgi:hypothetical protein